MALCDIDESERITHAETTCFGNAGALIASDYCVGSQERNLSRPLSAGVCSIVMSLGNTALPSTTMPGAHFSRPRCSRQSSRINSARTPPARSRVLGPGAICPKGLLHGQRKVGQPAVRSCRTEPGTLQTHFGQNPGRDLVNMTFDVRTWRVPDAVGESQPVPVLRMEGVRGKEIRATWRRPAQMASVAAHFKVRRLRAFGMTRPPTSFASHCPSSSPTQPMSSSNSLAGRGTPVVGSQPIIS